MTAPDLSDPESVHAELLRLRRLADRVEDAVALFRQPMETVEECVERLARLVGGQR